MGKMRKYSVIGALAGFLLLSIYGCQRFQSIVSNLRSEQKNLRMQLAASVQKKNGLLDV